MLLFEERKIPKYAGKTSPSRVESGNRSWWTANALPTALFSGVTIPSVSHERRGFMSTNFTVSLLFVTLKICAKIGFPEQVVGRFTNGTSGPKSSPDFRETGPWT